MKEEDRRSEYTDMEPGALLSGEIEHRAALSTLARQAPAFKVESRPVTRAPTRGLKQPWKGRRALFKVSGRQEVQSGSEQ